MQNTHMLIQPIECVIFASLRYQFRYGCSKTEPLSLGILFQIMAQFHTAIAEYGNCIYLAKK